MLLLKKGEKADLTKTNPGLTKITVGLGWKADKECTVEFDIDASAFLLSGDGKCKKDEDVVFYGNPKGSNDEIIHSRDNLIDDKDAEQLSIDLLLIPSEVEKIAFTITIYDGEKRGQTFAQVSDVYVRVADDKNSEILRFDLGNAFSKETAVIAAELYRYKGEWKFSATGSGYFGGLPALCQSFGIEVKEEEAAGPTIFSPTAVASQHASVIEPVTQTALQEAPPAVTLTKIDLLKKQVKIILEKENISDQKARVGVIIDASGSMSLLYNRGTVQRAFERTLAVASCMDDDGNMDVWFFGSKSMRAPVANENNFEDYIKRVYPFPRVFGGLGCNNNEPAAMKDVIKKYTQEDYVKGMPVYLIFFSDGGIFMDNAISKLLVQASQYPIFWQFVGIGRADYGILRKLDTLPGRVVDNAGFFSLDDLDKISDEKLYARLLREFPIWIKEAKSKGIL